VEKNRKYFLTSLLFPLLIALNSFLPDAANRPNQVKGTFNLVLFGIFLLVLFFYLHGHRMGKQGEIRVRTVMDVSLLLGLFFLVWLLLIGKAGFLDPLRWPSPNEVFDVFRVDFDLLVRASSIETLKRLLLGYFLAMAAAIPLGLIIGRHSWLHDAFYYPVAKMIAPIPPIIFVPYAIELLPTIDQAVIFVIFVGAFWPIIVNTIYGVRGMDVRYIEAAKTLGGSEKRLYTRILFPAALPSIYAGLFLGLVIAFIVLAVAEGIGGSHSFPGLGWYVLYYADLFDYPKVLAAIFLVAFWVVIWTAVSDQAQKRALKWQRKGLE
jgi:NitT/TauT family transport system permease protein